MDIKTKKEFLIRSLESEAVTTAVGGSLNINPTIWERRLRDYQRQNLVFAELAELQDFRGPGAELKVTIDEAPDAANDLVETTDVSIEEFATRQVTHDPTEYGAAYQLTKKEARRSFFDIADRMVNKLGYATAIKKDKLAADVLYDAATETVYAGLADDRAAMVTAETALDLKALLKARRAINKNLYVPRYFVGTWDQEADMLNITGIQSAADFGGSEAIRRGVVGQVFGVVLIAADSADASAEDGKVSRGLMLGTTKTGEKCFGYGVKSDLAIETQYHARGRYWDIVADEEYDFVAYHPKAIVVVESFNTMYSS